MNFWVCEVQLHGVPPGREVRIAPASEIRAILRLKTSAFIHLLESLIGDRDIKLPVCANPWMLGSRVVRHKIQDQLNTSPRETLSKRGKRGGATQGVSTSHHSLLFPDPADRFLNVGDADRGFDLRLGRALSPAVELETRLQFARDEAG